MKIRRRSVAGRPLHRSPVLIAAVTVAALPVLFGTVRASIPDGGGKINGCYSASGGALRVVDTDQVPPDCRADENRLTWNQTGPQGISQYEIVTQVKDVAAGATAVISATCPAGKEPLGGGVDAFHHVGFLTVQDPLLMLGSAPNTGGWHVLVKNEASSSVNATVRVVCASIS